MFKLDQHIKTLLLQHDCVVIPDFGGFVAHHIPARFADDGHIMLPPSRTVGFNPSLKVNDSLLIQSYVDAYDMSYPEAQTMLENEIAEFKDTLLNNGSFTISSVGTLTASTDGSVSFHPSESGILTPSLFGFADINLIQGNSYRTKDSNIVSIFENASEDSAEDAEYEDDNVVKISVSVLKKVVAAIAVIAVLAIAYPLSRNYDTSALMSSFDSFLPAKKSSIIKKVYIVKKSPVKAEQKNSQDPLLKTQSSKFKTLAPKPYTIVLAARISKKNAENYVEQLHKLGFQDAKVIGKGKARKVIFGSFDTQDEARKVRNSKFAGEDFTGVWILKQKV